MSSYYARKSPSSADRIEYQQHRIISGNVLNEGDLKIVEEKSEDVTTRNQTTLEVGHLDSVENFGDLLRTNIRPSRMQALTLARILEQKNLDVGDVEAEAFRLQLDYNRLILKMREIDSLRGRKRDDATFYKFMLSGVRLLPPEVLVIIFHYAMSRNAPTRQGCSPFGISQVCSAWRNAIIGCSSFWTELELRPAYLDVRRTSADGPVPEPRIVDVLNTWFARASRAHRLRLTMAFEPELEERFDPHGLVQGVTSIAPRLTNLLLLFCFKDHPFILSLLTLPSGASGGMFPVLEKLTLIEDYFPSDDDGPPNITVFGSSPRLSALILSVRPPRVTDSARMLLPWSQLTHLELVRVVSFQVLAKALFQCPQLHSAYVPHIDVANAEPTDLVVPPHRVTFPNLQSLSLGVFGSMITNDQGEAVNVLAALHLPKLKTLELYAVPEFDDIEYIYFPLFAVIAGISDTYSHIRHLLLSHVDTTAVDIPLIFRMCANLEALALYIPDMDPLETLTSLKTVSSDTGDYKPLHPKLISFAFAFHVDDNDAGLDINSVGEAFSGLCECWAKDPLRELPLGVVSLLVCDYNLVAPSPSAAATKAMFDNIRSHLDTLECPFEGSFDSHLVHSPKSLSSSLGLNDERPYISTEQEFFEY
ncbi:hypothetical protein DXG01_000743 [Tephrocybe rancida]|nr:hypothetical protein DXG01_000743 [Tephrocybe rancida]